MSDQTVKVLASIRTQEWPLNRAKESTYRKLVAAEGEAALRVTICAYCGAESPLTDGPCGRAWFRAHKCRRLTVIEGGQA